VLSLDEGGYSNLLSSIGIGALIAGLWVATFGGAEQRRRRMLVVGLVVVAGALEMLSKSDTLSFAIVACVLFGFGMILFLANGQSIVQLSTTNAQRGRVMAIWAMTLTGSVPIGHLILGTGADMLGDQKIVAVMAIAIGCLSLLTLAMILNKLSRSSSESGPPLAG
jgi:MFS family permease